MTEALPNDIAPARQKTRHASYRPLRTAAALAGLTMALPITLAAVGACLAVRAVSRADGEASNASAEDSRPRKTVNTKGNPPALLGRQTQFDNSGSRMRSAQS